MIFIWYNPDKDQFQKGTILEYDRMILKSENSDRFDLLYEFNRTTIRLADKILKSLNLAHEIKLEAH
ncbi:MAG: hypothetical protein JXQ90_15930 [Cyclobacteriaceae bacterium]